MINLGALNETRVCKKKVQGNIQFLDATNWGGDWCILVTRHDSSSDALTHLKQTSRSLTE